MLDEPVPAHRGARCEQVGSERAPGRVVVHEPADRGGELRRDHLAEEIVVVVDGRGRDVDLRGPVGLVPFVRTAHELEALDEVPPARVVISVGLRVEAALEMRHDEDPPGEHEEVRAARGAQPRRELGNRRRRDPRHLFEPVGIADEPAASHRDALGEAQVHGAQQPRQLAADTVEVDRVAELVEHRLRPPFAGRVVAEYTDVAAAVDVDTECVLDLARARCEIAARDDAADVEPDRVERADRERFEVGVTEVRVEVDADVAGRVLEEGIVVVPGAQPIDRDPETGRELPVELALERSERSRGELVDLGERREQAFFVEVGGRERQGEVVAVPERARGVVAEPGEAPYVGRDRGADALGGGPRSLALRAVGARAQYVDDLVVVDLDAVDGAAMAREPRLDAALQLDDLAPQVGLGLVRCEQLLEYLELTGELGVGARLRARAVHLRECGRVGERVGERDIGLGPDPLRLVARIDVRDPPRRVGRSLERLERRGAGRDDLGRGHLNQMRW